MKVLIADDEPVARLVLRELLEAWPGIQIAGEASTGLEAVEQAARLRPDVILLDLEMPGLTGFQVARRLRAGGKPLLIFVTAYQKHALEAFDAGAVDYLLKPVRSDRLEVALGKARAQLAGMPGADPAVEPRKTAGKIVGRLGGEMHLLDAAEVIAFQAEGDVVYIVTAKGRFYANHTLRSLEEKLPPHQFRRIHRATIINADHIRKISPLSSKRWMLRMTNGMEFVVSKRLTGVVREETGW